MAGTIQRGLNPNRLTSFIPRKVRRMPDLSKMREKGGIMNKPKSPPRRQFLTLISAAAPACALAGWRLAKAAVQAAPAQDEKPKHKFQDKSDMSFEQVFRFGFRPFVGILRVLSTKPGYEKLLEVLPEVSSQLFATNIRNRKTQDRSLQSYTEYLKKPDHFWKNAITAEIVEDTPTAFGVKVTECLWAKTFREVNAADIGYACICHPDFATATAFNPKMKMERTKTLMQGHDCCNHRWMIEA